MNFFVSADENHIKRERAKARELRKTQWWKQKLSEGLCYYCEEKVGASELTMDHVVPIVRGGKSTKGNLVCACKECNSEKKYFTPAEIILGYDG